MQSQNIISKSSSCPSRYTAGLALVCSDMTVSESPVITLTDGGHLINLGGCGCKGGKAELHLYYYLFPSLCKACDCSNPPCSCLNYSALFDTFLRETGRPAARQLSKRQIPAALSD